MLLEAALNLAPLMARRTKGAEPLSTVAEEVVALVVAADSPKVHTFQDSVEHMSFEAG